MRLLAWNLNHRAARRQIPAWISQATAEASPDVAIFTEYVEGADHGLFLSALKSDGLGYFTISERPQRQNQVLIASREPHVRHHVKDPGIHQSVPSNILHVQLDSGTQVLGFRMPAYEKKDAHLKRPTWTWLLEMASRLRQTKSLIAGDFNTAPGDSSDYCGDCLTELIRLGWIHAQPESGYSWRRKPGGERKIDHAFLSPSFEVIRATYSWSFHDLSPDAAKGVVGRPDHAMLLVDFQPRDVHAPAA